MKTSWVGATATRKSAAVSALGPNGTHPLLSPVRSTARARQWYAVLSPNPETEAVATWPLATATPMPVTTPSNAVPTGLTSTSSCSWSPGFTSVTVAVKSTDRPAAVPPTAMVVLPSLCSWPSAVGDPGGTGMEVLKSGASSGLPPNGVQALARPVWSTTRCCQ